MDELPFHIKSFICPISMHIMRTPVIASDGIMYEKNELRRYCLKTYGDVLSPLTRAKLVRSFKNGNCYYAELPIIKSIIDDYFVANPHHEHYRYVEYLDITEFFGLDVNEKVHHLYWM